MLVDGDTVAWVGSEQAAHLRSPTASMEVIDLHGALRGSRLRRLPRRTSPKPASPWTPCSWAGAAPPGNCSTPSPACASVPGGRHRAGPRLGRDPVAGPRAAVRRRSWNAPPAARQVYLSRVRRALGARVLLAGGGRRASTGSTAPVRAARSQLPRTLPRGWRPAGCPPPRSAGTSSGPSPRRQPTATSRWRKWRRRTSAAPKTCSSPRPGTPGRTRPSGDPAVLGRAGRLGGACPVHPGRAWRARAAGWRGT